MANLDRHGNYIEEPYQFHFSDSRHEYPRALFAAVAAKKGVIRLHVAAMVVCIDHGQDVMLGDQQVEREVESFRRGDDTVGWGFHPHQYLDREMEGVLRPIYLQILKALLASIQIGELKPIYVRKSLAGEIDPLRTWIETDDLLAWCDVRHVCRDSCFVEYVTGERNIAEATFSTAVTERELVESRTSREETAQKLRDMSEDEILRYTTELATENASLRRLQESNQGRPLLTRERNVLLNIIAALCKEQKIDYTKPSKAANLL